jgi:hypothetical protein
MRTLHTPSSRLLARLLLRLLRLLRLRVPPRHEQCRPSRRPHDRTLDPRLHPPSRRLQSSGGHTGQLPQRLRLRPLLRLRLVLRRWLRLLLWGMRTRTIPTTRKLLKVMRSGFPVAQLMRRGYSMVSIRHFGRPLPREWGVVVVVVVVAVAVANRRAC